MPFCVRVRSALQSYGSGLDWIDRRAIGIMRRSTDSLGGALCSSRASSWPSSKYPKKTSSPNVKEKRKAGTRAGLRKAAIAAAAKLIESVGANGFSLRKLAKALGVGPTTIHFHFEGGVGAVFSAVAQQALAGVTRPYKPKEEPAAYLAELLLKIMEALHARPVIAKFVVLQLSSNPLLDLLAERVLLALAALGAPTEARPKMFQRAMGVIFEMI